METPKAQEIVKPTAAGKPNMDATETYDVSLLRRALEMMEDDAEAEQAPPDPAA